MDGLMGWMSRGEVEERDVYIVWWEGEWMDIKDSKLCMHTIIPEADLPVRQNLVRKIGSALHRSADAFLSSCVSKKGDIPMLMLMVCHKRV